MGTHNTYSIEEIEYIKNNYKSSPIADLVLKLGRSRSSIAKQANILGIKKIKQSRIENLTNKRFQRLTVIKFVNIEEKWGSAVWECLCDCGNITNVLAGNLKNKNSKSCGCLTRDGQYEAIHKRAYEQHWRNAQRRGYENYLTQDAYIDIIKKPCAYCNSFSIRKNISTHATLELNSADRIDNESYYVVENTQSVCFDCQQMKSDMTHKEFLEHNYKIYKNVNKT